MSIIPIATAAQLLPAALVAGRAATNALGSFAEMLRDAVDGSSSDNAPPSKTSETATAGELPSGLGSLLRDFAAAFNRLLENQNLDSGPGVLLGLNAAGDVEVAGSHPRASAIQNLLAKTPQISELFRTIAEKATAHRKDQEFAAFQENSRSPSEEFPLLFSKEHAPRFQLRIQGGSATTAFV